MGFAVQCLFGILLLSSDARLRSAKMAPHDIAEPKAVSPARVAAPVAAVPGSSPPPESVNRPDIAVWLRLGLVPMAAVAALRWGSHSGQRDVAILLRQE